MWANFHAKPRFYAKKLCVFNYNVGEFAGMRNETVSFNKLHAGFAGIMSQLDGTSSGIGMAR